MNQNANHHRKRLPFLIQLEHDTPKKDCTEIRSRISDFGLLKSEITASSGDGHDNDAASVVRFLPDEKNCYQL